MRRPRVLAGAERALPTTSGLVHSQLPEVVTSKVRRTSAVQTEPPPMSTVSAPVVLEGQCPAAARSVSPNGDWKPSSSSASSSSPGSGVNLREVLARVQPAVELEAGTGLDGVVVADLFQIGRMASMFFFPPIEIPKP